MRPSTRPTPQRRTALRRLDDSLVPRLRPAARGVGRAVGAPARALRALDDRLGGGRIADAIQSHRTMVVFVVVALAFGSTAVHAQRYPELRDAPSASTGDGQVGDAGPDDDDGGIQEPDSIGPEVGQDVDDYLEEAAERLAEADGSGPWLAVVSLDDFATAATVADLFGEDATLHAAMYQLPERNPRPQRLDVTGGLTEQVEGLVEEIVEGLRLEESEVQSTIESGVEDPDFLADYEVRLDELKAIRNVLTQRPEILYAIVVSAPPDALRDLAGQDLVRAVDVAGAGAEAATTAVGGLLPTDRDTVSVGLAG